MEKQMNSLREIADLIKKYDNFVISGHVDPDGDCVGSMLAMAGLLEKLGKKYRLLLERPLPINLQSLESEADFQYVSDFTFTKDDQVFLSLDSGDLGRVPPVPEHNLIMVNIDHHMSNSMYGEYNYVDTQAAAVGEIMYQLIQELDVEIDKKMAYYIMVALIWDTGNFKHSNTSSQVLRIAADILDLGIDANAIYRKFLGSHSLGKTRLRGQVYSNMQMAHDSRVAWVLINQELLEKADACLDDAYSLVSDLRDIRGVEVGLTFIEQEPGLIKLGFRSNEYVPVNEVAMAFGGGGHKRASGAEVRLQDQEEPKDLIERVLNKIGEYLE